MIKKIIILSLILLISIINVNATSGSGTFETSTTAQYTGVAAGSSMGSAALFNGIIFENIENLPYPTVSTTKILNTYWTGNTGDGRYQTVSLQIGAVDVGTAYLGYNAGIDGHYYVNVFFNDDVDLSGYSGTQLVTVTGYTYNDIAVSNNLQSYMDYSAGGGSGATISFSSSAWEYSIGCTSVTKTDASYKNTYEWFYDNTVLRIEVNRNSTNPSKIYIRNNTQDLMYHDPTYESTYLLQMFECDNTENPFYMNCTFSGSETLETTINYYTPPEELFVIEVDDTVKGGILDVGVYNIDYIRNNHIEYGSTCYQSEPLYLQLYINRGLYDELIYNQLLTDDTDTIHYIDTTNYDLGNYKAMLLCQYEDYTNGAGTKEFKITSVSNYSITVNPNNVYVGDTVNLIYSSLNKSHLSVFDHSGVKIDTWLNLQGTNQIVYQIPPDYDYQHSYSDWYVYLNDTGNSSNNHRFNFTVDWRVYIEPEPTPEPTEDYYNVSIEENIDNVKDSMNPILELVFGLTTIFVDNPDYNDDNIIDVNEISVWLNSLITICIVIFIFILYKVYSRR